MEKFTEKEIKEGLNKAYKEAGHNAYFGSGFRAGIDFVNQGQNLPISNVSILFLNIDQDGDVLSVHRTEEGAIQRRLEMLEGGVPKVQCCKTSLED